MKFVCSILFRVECTAVWLTYIHLVLNYDLDLLSKKLDPFINDDLECSLWLRWLIRLCKEEHCTILNCIRLKCIMKNWHIRGFPFRKFWRYQRNCIYWKGVSMTSIIYGICHSSNGFCGIARWRASMRSNCRWLWRINQAEFERLFWLSGHRSFRANWHRPASYKTPTLGSNRIISKVSS